MNKKKIEKKDLSKKWMGLHGANTKPTALLENASERFDKALVFLVMFYILILVFLAISPDLSILLAFSPLIISLFFMYIKRNETLSKMRGLTKCSCILS